MKNINSKWIIIIALFFGVLTSCNDDDIIAEGPIITKILTVDAFSGIDLTGPFNVTIMQGATQKVEATGQENIIDRLEKDVNSGIWEIELENGNYQQFDLSIAITIPLLSAIEISGSGDVVVQDFTNQNDLRLEISGSGEVEVNTFNGCQNLDVEIDGSGNINCLGAFDALNNLDIEIGGSGSFNGFPAVTNNCTIDIPGSGTCAVYVNNTLDVKIKGSGIVRYKGFPTITQDTNAAGQIIDAN